MTADLARDRPPALRAFFISLLVLKKNCRGYDVVASRCGKGAVTFSSRCHTTISQHGWPRFGGRSAAHLLKRPASNHHGVRRISRRGGWPRSRPPAHTVLDSNARAFV